MSVFQNMSEIMAMTRLSEHQVGLTVEVFIWKFRSEPAHTCIQLTSSIKGYLGYCTANFSLNVQTVRTAEFSPAFAKLQDFETLGPAVPHQRCLSRSPADSRCLRTFEWGHRLTIKRNQIPSLRVYL